MRLEENDEGTSRNAAMIPTMKEAFSRIKPDLADPASRKTRMKIAQPVNEQKKNEGG